MESPALSLISANQDLIAVSASPRKVTFNKLIWNYLVSGTTRCSPKKSHLAWNDQLLARNFFSCPLLPLKVSCFVQLLAITFYLVDGMLPNLWIKEKSQLDLEMNCGGSEQVTPRCTSIICTLFWAKNNFSFRVKRNFCFSLYLELGLRALPIIKDYTNYWTCNDLLKPQDTLSHA